MLLFATIRVLKSGARQVAQYFHVVAGAAYYAAQRIGTWWGPAAEPLGLTGDVTQEVFEQILVGNSPRLGWLVSRPGSRSHSKPKKKRQPIAEANHPESETPSNSQPETLADQIRARQQRPFRRVHGYDVTFSVPKSVSVLWAIGSQEIRDRIEQIVESAAHRTLDTLQQHVPLIRRGKGSKQREFGDLVAATFLHFLNRNQEPQAHVHCVIANLAQAPDGKWFGVNSRLLHQWTPTLGRIFRCELAHELQQQLGVELYRPMQSAQTSTVHPDDRHHKSTSGFAESQFATQDRRETHKRPVSWFEIKGIPHELLQHFSSRRQEIEAQVERDGRSVTDTRARQAAAFSTRAVKEQDVELTRLFPKWKQAVRDLGFDPQKLPQSVLGHTAKPLSNREYDKAFADSLKRLTEKHAHLADRDMVREVCEELQHRGVAADKLTKRILSDLERSPQVIPLQASPEQPRRYTTPEMWNLERALLDDIQQLKSRAGNVVSQRTTEKALRENPLLSGEQRAAARKLLTKPQAIRVIQGVAGAGKSTMLKAVAQSFHQDGFKVIGGALAGAAREELYRKTGINSRTVASYLYHWDGSRTEKALRRLKHDARMLTRAAWNRETFAPFKIKIDRKTVIILDEAGMLDTHSLQRLISHVNKAGATLILCGDTKQLQPIAAGGPLATNRSGSRASGTDRKLPAAEQS